MVSPIPPAPPNFWLGTWARPPDHPSQVALGAAMALLVLANRSRRTPLARVDARGHGRRRPEASPPFSLRRVVRRGLSLARLHRALSSRRSPGPRDRHVLAAGPRPLAWPPRLGRARSDGELPCQEPASHPAGSARGDISARIPAASRRRVPARCPDARRAAGRRSPRPGHLASRARARHRGRRGRRAGRVDWAHGGGPFDRHRPRSVTTPPSRYRRAPQPQR